MPRERETRAGRNAQRPGTEGHMNHLRTEHTTPSRSRARDVMGPVAPRWRNPELARSSGLGFFV